MVKSAIVFEDRLPEVLQLRDIWALWRTFCLLMCWGACKSSFFNVLIKVIVAFSLVPCCSWFDELELARSHWCGSFPYLPVQCLEIRWGFNLFSVQFWYYYCTSIWIWHDVFWLIEWCLVKCLSFIIIIKSVLLKALRWQHISGCLNTPFMVMASAGFTSLLYLM